MESSLSRKWKKSLMRIQDAVSGELKEVESRIERMLESDFPPVNDILEYLFSSSGKLIRPTLMLICADRRHTPTDKLVRAGAAIELIHTASLVHDDSIDNSSFRRGAETLNSRWDDKTSVIIGDYLLAQAINEIGELGDISLVTEVAVACRHLAIGEMRQMNMEGKLDVGEEEYFEYIRQKTAELFACTAATAALLNNGEYYTELRRFGLLFGSLFQVTDDLLDYTGSSDDTGKPTGLDIRGRKMTLPLIHAVPLMDEQERREVAGIYSGGSEVTQPQVKRIQELVGRCGGIEYAKQKAAELAGQAAQALNGLPAGRSETLMELVGIIAERDR